MFELTEGWKNAARETFLRSIFFIMSYAKYDLIIFTKDGKRHSLVDEFKSGVTEFNMPSWETKELASNDWKDYDGDDVFIPEDGLRLQGADLEVSLCFDGVYGEWGETMFALVKMLRKGIMGVVIPYSSERWNSVYFKGLTDVDVFSAPSMGDVVEYKLKFRITQHSGVSANDNVYLVDDEGNNILDDNNNPILIG